MLLLILAKFQVCELNDLGRVGLNILERPCFKSVQLLDTRALSLSSWRHRFSNLIMFLEMICSSHSLTSSQLLVTLFYQLGATHPALPILRHQLCSQLGHMGWPDDDYWEYFCEILGKFDSFSHMKACPEEKSQQQSVWSVVPRFFNIYCLSRSTKTETRPAEGRLVTSVGGINARNSWESYCETNENNAHFICFLAPQKILLLTRSPRCSIVQFCLH